MARRVDGQRAVVARAEAATASWVRTTPFGWPEVPEVATTSASPSSTGNPSGSGVLLAVGADDAGRAQRVEHGPARGGREPRVERCGGVPGVPDGPEGIDETHPTREIECDELGHRPVA